MADISKITLPDSSQYNLKDAWLRETVGQLPSPYTQVEWVESNGQQFVYLDWKPPIATWGFDIDFLCKNAVNTTAGAWNPSTNVNGFGTIFAVRASNNVNNCQLSSYNSGVFRLGAGNVSGHGFVTDKTRQHMSLIGTTFTKPNGTTMTVTRVSETANNPYCNMTVFACHEGLRRSGTGQLIEPSTTRIYSLKFYESTTLKVDLVGAVRKSDGCTGLYDKVSKHFYPAAGMTYGNAVGDLGDIPTIAERDMAEEPNLIADNTAATRMWRVNAPTISKLEDGQTIVVTPRYNVTNSTQTTELAGWDDTSSNSNVYIKMTLADGTVTDWIPCWYAYTSRLTTHYQTMPIRMTYRENYITNSSSTAVTTIMRGWFCDANYDSNTYGYNYVIYQSAKTGAKGVWQTSLFMEDGNGTYQNICTAADGTVTSSNRTAGTTKIANSNGFKVGSTVWFCNGATVAANTNMTNWGQSSSSYYNVFDSRYSFNTSLVANSLTPYAPVYLVGEIGSDGLYYLDTVWWTQTPTTQGKVYVLVGGCYDSTTSNCRINLYEHNPWYVYDGTRLVELDHSRIRALEGAVSTSVGDQIRISDKAYTGGGSTVVYRKLAVLPIDNASNGSSIIISGRCGGWVQSNFGYIDVLLTNRTSAYSGDTITAAASSSGSSGMYGFCDVVAYAQTDKSAIVYLKLTSYYAYDLVMQTLSGVTACYSTDSVTPTGTLIWSLKDSPQTKLDVTGALTATKFIGPVEGNVTGNCSGTAANVTGTVAIANGGTGATTADAAWTALGGGVIGKKASLVASDIPAHAASGTTYGAGDGSNYGHVKLSAATNSSSGTSGGIAATPSAVKAAYDLASTANTTANGALSVAQGALVFDTVYTIYEDNGETYASFVAFVYQGGVDVTDQFDDSAFTWYLRLGTSLDNDLIYLGDGPAMDDIPLATASVGFGGSVICYFNDGN